MKAKKLVKETVYKLQMTRSELELIKEALEPLKNKNESLKELYADFNHTLLI